VIKNLIDNGAYYKERNYQDHRPFEMAANTDEVSRMKHFLKDHYRAVKQARWHDLKRRLAEVEEQLQSTLEHEQNLSRPAATNRSSPQPSTAVDQQIPQQDPQDPEAETTSSRLSPQQQ
jgi:hypothetical protein